MEADIGILLLPSVVSTSPPELSTDGTVMDRIAVAGSTKKLEDERDKAVREARLYRDLAERLRKEKGALQHEMHRRCEGIQDFWRNNLFEGCTRTGRMVKEVMFVCRNESPGHVP